MRMKRVCIVCAAVVSGAAIVPATAGAKTFKGDVSLDTRECQPPAQPHAPERCIAFGHVASQHAKCKPNRKVRFFRDGDLVGSDRTSAHGFWGVRFLGISGSYRAKMTRRVLRNG